jgi:small-conductance mechanosensitive channel
MWFTLVVLAARRVGSFAAPVLIAFLLASGTVVHAQRPLPDDDILDYLRQTITWYRDVAAVAQSSADAGQVIFADGLHQSSIQALRLAFEFARAQAAIPAASAAADNAPPDAARSRTLAQSLATAEQRAEQAQQEIEQINRQLQSAPERSRTRLLALRDEVTSEANFAKARRDALRSMIGFLSAPDEGGLTARIGELERSVPEAAAHNQKPSAEPAPSVRTAAAPEFHPESAGIIGLTTEVFSVSQKMRRLERLAQETDALRHGGEKLRGPLRSALREVIRRGDALAQMPESADLAALTAQRKELDGLSARFKQLSASSAPLSEQSTQIGAARGRILEWRGSLRESYSSALRYLLLRIGMLAVVLLLVFGFSELWRRATMRYVQDLRRRRQFLLLRRIVVGCAVGLIIALSFVSEFGSLATFAGFSAAGIAVAMQSVILSVVAYFFLVGRWGVRVGDRVTVAGVTGEVADIGLFRLYLMELGGSSLALQPTGRIVVFPNSVFFQPAAMFKQLPGVDYAWRTITLKLSGSTDYALVERRLLDAVESVYAEYRESVERQHRTAHSSLNLHTAAPRPESRVRFVDSSLEITILYPVEIRRAAEIDDRITREVIQQVEKDPKLGLAGGAFQVAATDK